MRLLALLFVTSIGFSNTMAQNIALGKNAVSSSVENFDNTNYNPYQAIDGLGNSNVNQTNGQCIGGCSRWSSLPLDNQYIYIDLAANYNLSEVRLYWAPASGKNFTIDVSYDGNVWTTVSTVNNNAAFYNSLMLPPGTMGRYVRMMGITRNTAAGFSLYEFEVYGTRVVALGSNFAFNAPAVASSTSGGTVAGNATDGQGTDSQVDYNGNCTGACTFWSSASGAAQWIYVDLGAVRSLSEARFYYQGNNSPNSFTVDVSNDAATWQPTAVVVSGNYGHANTVNISGSTGRYVRLNLSTNNASIYSLYEFEVYGMASTLPVHFTSFTGRELSGSVSLQWTASIDAPTVFDVERSIDGINYTVIGKVNANGPLQSTTTFSFKDPNPARGNNYYRLQYVEQGRSSVIFSKVVAVGIRKGETIEILPNPVRNNRFSLNFGEAITGKTDIAIYSSTGAMVHRETKQLTRSTLLTVDMPRRLPAGVYSVQVTAGSSRQQGRLVVAD